MPKPLVVIGGGITGLAAAYLAARAGRSVTVLEKSSKMGGLLETFPIGGNRLEFFYHHFFTHDVELLWLLEELGLENEIDFKKGTMGVFRNGKIYDFNGPVDLLKFSPMGFFDKARFAFSSLFLGKFARWQEWEDRPALEWFYRFAGRNATESLWKPLLDIKFGPFASQIPAAWMVGRLRQRMNSRKGAEERLGYLRGSLDVLLQALMKKLQCMGVELVSNANLESLKIEHGRLQAIQTSQKIYSDSDFLFTMPTIYLAPLLEKECPDLARQLGRIQYFGAVCLVLETKRPLSPIYWLNVADEGFPFGGIIEHTNLISPSEYGGAHVVYLSRYFAHSDPIAKMSSEEIKDLMLPSLAKIYPHFSMADVCTINVFRASTAAVVCDLKFSEKVPACRTPISGMFLANMAHVYPDERSCNNSIRVAAEACRVMGIDSSFIPANASLSGQIAMK